MLLPQHNTINTLQTNNTYTSHPMSFTQQQYMHLSHCCDHVDTLTLKGHGSHSACGNGGRMHDDMHGNS
jgi:hypothetical protein